MLVGGELPGFGCGWAGWLIGVVQATSRSLIVDTLPVSEQQLGSAWGECCLFYPSFMTLYFFCFPSSTSLLLDSSSLQSLPLCSYSSILLCTETPTNPPPSLQPAACSD